MIDSFSFTINTNPMMLNYLDGNSNMDYGRKVMEFDLHALVQDATFENKENVDVSDFYDMEECKKLSKIIQRKFDKILEKEEWPIDVDFEEMKKIYDAVEIASDIYVVTSFKPWESKGGKQMISIQLEKRSKED